MVFIKGYIGNDEKEFSLLNLVEQVQKEKGDTIHVVIDSLGGDLDIGFSMYDYLLRLDKTVITESVNNCASAATLPFIAGDKRIAGSPIMIHNPYLSGVTGDGDALRAAAEYVEEAEKKAEKIYSERSKVEADTLSELMKTDTYMSPSQAVTLGFATEAKQTVYAKIDTSNINKNEKKMSEKKSAGERLAEFFGKKKAAKDPVVYNMDLHTADGETTLYVDREEGEPQVGDKASPDGSHVMPDGTTIVVLDGTITEILPNVEDADEEGEITEAEAEEAVQLIEEVIQENEDLKVKVEKLEAEVVQARTIMNAVKMAGGAEKVFKDFKSGYKAQGRTGNRNKGDVQKNALQDRIQALKEKGGK